MVGVLVMVMVMDNLLRVIILNKEDYLLLGHGPGYGDGKGYSDGNGISNGWGVLVTVMVLILV
jgi:hypothetical protein